MSAPDPVPPSSQDARVDFDPGGKPEDLVDSINEVVSLIRADIQRLSNRDQSRPVATFTSGNYRAVMPYAGIARCTAITDTATSSSNAFSKHNIRITKNGAFVTNTPNWSTANVELRAYGAGISLGEVTVGAYDVLAISVVVTGGPAPTLSTSNFMLVYTLQAS